VRCNWGRCAIGGTCSECMSALETLDVLSRLMLWFSLEAKSTWWCDRYFVFKQAIEDGRLRLRYP
jgi:hypothetical protein